MTGDSDPSKRSFWREGAGVLGPGVGAMSIRGDEDRSARWPDGRMAAATVLFLLPTRRGSAAQKPKENKARLFLTLRLSGKFFLLVDDTCYISTLRKFCSKLCLALFGCYF